MMKAVLALLALALCVACARAQTDDEFRLIGDGFFSCQDTCPADSCLQLRQLTPADAQNRARFRLTVDASCFKFGSSIDYLALVIGAQCFPFRNVLFADSIDFTATCNTEVEVFLKDKLLHSCGAGKEDIIPDICYETKFKFLLDDLSHKKAKACGPFQLTLLCPLRPVQQPPPPPVAQVAPPPPPPIVITGPPPPPAAAVPPPPPVAAAVPPPPPEVL